MINTELFKYAKSLLLFNIHQSEVFEKQDTNEVRSQSLKRLEQQIRTQLKSISLQEELFYQINQYQIQENKSKIEIAPSSDKLIEKKQEIINFISGKLGYIDPNEQNLIFNMKEESISYYEAKLIRVTLMLRSRQIIIDINNSLGLYFNIY